MDKITRELSGRLADLKYEEIPADVIEFTKVLTLHVLAASFGALPIPQAQNTIDLVAKKRGTEEATVWGGKGLRAPAEDAAFANGTLSDILDWEDCSWTGHPSAGAIPVALAMAEARGRSGKDYLEAVVTAYEGYQRIALTAMPSPGHQWGMLSWQVFAGALAAAKILRFNEDQFDQTIGVASYQSTTVAGKHGEKGEKSDVYHFVHGLVARNGVSAALLTEAGFANNYGCLDAPGSYSSAISDTVDESWFLKDWKTHWMITETYFD